jgi:hypothetical protein
LDCLKPASLPDYGCRDVMSWSTRRRDASVEPPAAPAMTSEKLLVQSLVILARAAPQRLADLAAKRSIAA